MNKRDLNLEKYGIHKKRYRELKAFCEQYPIWKAEIKNHSFVKGIDYSGSPKPSNKNVTDVVANDAIRLNRYAKNCAMVEKVAQAADNEFWNCLIKVICYEVPLTYLISMGEFPLEKSAFYERRRYFFYLLDIEKNTEA